MKARFCEVRIMYKFENITEKGKLMIEHEQKKLEMLIEFIRVLSK